MKSRHGFKKIVASDGIEYQYSISSGNLILYGPDGVRHLISGVDSLLPLPDGWEYSSTYYGRMNDYTPGEPRSNYYGSKEIVELIRMAKERRYFHNS